jgi:hypothetical protein
MGMKKFGLRWVLHELPVPQKGHRVADTERRLQTLRANTPDKFINIITADESWYHWFYRRSSQSSTSRDLVPTRMPMKIDSRKSMFTLILSGHGLLALAKLPEGCKINNKFFCDVVFE